MRLRHWPGLVVLLGALGCSPPAADVAVTIVPNPIPITGFNFGHGMIFDQARFTVQVAELAGLGFDIEALTVQGVDVATGIAVGEGDLAGGTTPFSFPRHVDAHESVAIELAWAVRRDLGDAFRPRRFEVTLRFTDDKGNRGERKLTAPGAYQ